MNPLILTLFIFSHGSSDSVLTWEDFKATPIDSTYANGMKVVGRSSFGMTYEYEESDGNFTFTVKPVFYPEESWLLEKSTKVLLHENCHYALCRLCCAECQKEINSYHSKLTIAKAQKIFVHWNREVDSLNDLFDQQSVHGSNKKIEALWENNTNKNLKR